MCYYIYCNAALLSPNFYSGFILICLWSAALCIVQLADFPLATWIAVLHQISIKAWLIRLESYNAESFSAKFDRTNTATLGTNHAEALSALQERALIFSEGNKFDNCLGYLFGIRDDLGMRLVVMNGPHGSCERTARSQATCTLAVMMAAPQILRVPCSPMVWVLTPHIALLVPD